MKKVKLILLSIVILTTTFMVGSNAMEIIRKEQGVFRFEDYDNAIEIQNELLKKYPTGSNINNLKNFLIDSNAVYIGEKEINKNERIKQLNTLFSENKDNTEYKKQLSKIQQEREGNISFFRYSKSSSFGSISAGWMIKVFISNDKEIKNIEVSKELTGI